MGKLKRIKQRFLALEEKVNLASEKLASLESFQTDMIDLKGKFDILFEMFTAQQSEEMTPEEIKEQEEAIKENMEMIKTMVQQAIIEMLAKKENQEAIHAFASQFTASMTGQAGGLPFDLAAASDADGNLDPIKAGFMWLATRAKEGKGGTASSLGGLKKTTGY